MTHLTDEELDALVKWMENVSLQVGVPSRTVLDSDVIRRAADSINALRAQIAAANARADRAEAALAAQIEVDARIADHEAHHAMREGMCYAADGMSTAYHAIHAQPHDRTALDRIIADTRAKALTWAADQLNDSHILSAALRTGYETPEDRIAAQDRVAAAAVKSFCGAKDETEALKMALRHAEDRIEAARSRIVAVKAKIEDCVALAAPPSPQGRAPEA